MTRNVTAITLTVLIIMFSGAVLGETKLAPTSLFEATAIAPDKNTALLPIHLTVQSWGIPAGARHEIPVRGFYVAHLLSGDIATTVDGQTSRHSPDEYWTVKSGLTMEVNVLGEFAVLETIVPGKP